jgi:hypothetical protein
MIQKKSGCKFVIPESLQKKRLEELDRKELWIILGHCEQREAI